MRKSFVTGLVILLPLALTIALVIFTVNFLTKPFVDFFQSLLNHFGVIRHGFLFLSDQQVLHYVSQLLILIFLASFTLLLGFLGRMVMIHSLLSYGGRLLHKIPLVNKIYRTSKDVVRTLMEPESHAFKQVVLVPFPQPGALSLGFLTQVEEDPHGGVADSSLMTVFVPATPNPTMGYLVVYKKDQITFLDMKVEEALKTIISCGLIFAKLKKR